MTSIMMTLFYGSAFGLAGASRPRAKHGFLLARITGRIPFFIWAFEMRKGVNILLGLLKNILYTIYNK